MLIFLIFSSFDSDLILAHFGYPMDLITTVPFVTWTVLSISL